MCVCFTPSQQDNYKCCLACDRGLGNAIVTVKARMYQGSGLCADTWIGSYTGSGKRTFLLLGMVTTPLLGWTGGGLWDLIRPRVISRSQWSTMTVLTSLQYYLLVAFHSCHNSALPFSSGVFIASQSADFPLYLRLGMTGSWASGLCYAQDVDWSWWGAGKFPGRGPLTILGEEAPSGPQSTYLTLTCLRCQKFSTRLCFALRINIFVPPRPRSNRVLKEEMLMRIHW